MICDVLFAFVLELNGLLDIFLFILLALWLDLKLALALAEKSSLWLSSFLEQPPRCLLTLSDFSDCFAMLLLLRLRLTFDPALI